jgi:protein-disulfide isomerase
LAVVADIAAIGTAAVISVTALSVLVAVHSGRISARPTSARVESRTAVSPVTPVAERIASGSKSVRPATARVALVEFADYDCRFCAQFEKEVFPVLRREFIDVGTVAFIYRDFPLERIHPLALRASVAAECAAAQGKYWDMHIRLFDIQAGKRSPDFVADAKAVRLNLATFEQCMQKEREDDIREDIRVGRSLGITGTPTFFLGKFESDGQILLSKRLSGAQSVAVFRQEIASMVREPESTRPR